MSNPKPPPRHFVAAPDATDAQMMMDGGYSSKEKASSVAAVWNNSHPSCPVIVHTRVILP